MSNILIAGDSWGCGEWNVECTQILHAGLEYYLGKDGHQVVNISKGASSNLDSVDRINLWFDRFGDQQIDKIFVFQTEYTRDIKHATENDWNISSLTQLSSLWTARFYIRLSEIAQHKSCKIYVLGGCSDTDWFDNMSNDYPGVELGCQSVTNLLVNNNSKIETPVFSWYDKFSVPILEKIKSKNINLEDLLYCINLGFERESLLRSCPELFFPDGKHPNREGHLRLYNFLKEKSYV